MAKGSKLKAALDNFKGVNHKLEHQKQLQKNAEKRKRARVENDDAVAPAAAAVKPSKKGGKEVKRDAKRSKLDAAAAAAAADEENSDAGEEEEEEEDDEEESEGEGWETDEETHAVRLPLVCDATCACTCRRLTMIFYRATLRD